MKAQTTKLNRSRTIKHSDGIEVTWNYDEEITTRGPYSVEISYPKGYDYNANHGKYFSPTKGKEISKQRAYQLGIKDE